MNNLIAEEEEEIWRGRRDRMNNAIAASRTVAGQGPAETYEAACRLMNIINNADIEEFISVIESFADRTDLFAVLNTMGPGKESLLHRAASARKDDILRLLIDSVGDHLIDARNEWGNTPLHMVARLGGSTRAAEMLIRRARDLPNVKNKNRLLRIKNKQGNTALHRAVINRHANLVRYLLSEDLEPVYWKNAEVLFLLLLEPSRIEGLPAVHGAIAYNKRDLFTLILEKNMKLFAMTDSGGGNPGFKFLRSETEYLVRKWDMNGDLPIHIASKMVPWRLNRRGQTILHVAAKYGRASVVKYILRDPELRRELNARDYAGNTALHLTAMHSQPAALIHLVWSEGIVLCSYNNKCLTTLDIARGIMKWGVRIESNRRQRPDLERTLLKNQRESKLSTAREQPSILTPPQLAFLALACSMGGKVPRVSTDLLLLRPEARDKEFASLVLSRKDMPNRNIVKDYINSRMVVATLVATVTFAAGFAVPGGFNSSDTASKDDRGMATMLDKGMFQAFAICNTITMFCSMTAVVNLIWVLLVDVNIAVAALEHTTLPLKIALPAMSTAFLTGVTLTAGKLPWLANTLFYLGLLFLLIISSAKLLERPPFFMIHYAPIHRLTFWLILAYIYLWRVGTYIYDDAEDNRTAKKTFASPPANGADKLKTDDSVKAKCGDVPHPPSQ
ncbi:hypothetical protein BT93_L2780 [Corymbia citriodora subsp. variegata]|uniref:PGG domain-containing protein n=1 Tax=Corymbia citriodora subsp. variegata TaxID=360336 RepID=A0A8T0CJ79_CORYI|nr:hypothetical protein BT93_L2780 [Corymbia citriodora subsp. variegata]